MSDTASASAFTLPGGTAVPIAKKITGTSATAIAGNANFPVRVVWFQVTEIANGTGTMSIDMYDGTTAYFIRASAAMVAHTEYLYGRGFWLPKGYFLRVTTGTANTVDVVGMASIPQAQTG